MSETRQLDDAKKWWAEHHRDFIGEDGMMNITEILAAYDAGKATTVDYSAILERERTQVAEGVTAVKKAIQCREWLTEGRGSYEWDDDRWHDEFAAAIQEILDALKPLEKIAADWSNCPQTAEAVQKARSQPTATPGQCPLCRSTQKDVYLPPCDAYRLRKEPAHIFHWDSTTDEQRRRMGEESSWEAIADRLKGQVYKWQAENERLEREAFIGRQLSKYFCESDAEDAVKTSCEDKFAHCFACGERKAEVENESLREALRQLVEADDLSLEGDIETSEYQRRMKQAKEVLAARESGDAKPSSLQSNDVG